MTNKNAYAQSGVDVGKGYEVVERIKNTLQPVQSVRCCGSSGVSGCLTFQKQVSKSLF